MFTMVEGSLNGVKSHSQSSGRSLGPNAPVAALLNQGPSDNFKSTSKSNSYPITIQDSRIMAADEVKKAEYEL